MSDHSVHIWSSMTGHQAACSCKWTGEEYATKAEAEAQRDRHIAGERIMAAHIAETNKIADGLDNMFGAIDQATIEALNAPHRDTPMQPLVYVPPVAHALTRLELEVALIALELYSDRALSKDKHKLTLAAIAKISAMLAVIE